jgi:hypothetical protein
MKAQYICLTFLATLFSLASLAQQTGVNTKSPKGTLHVDPKKNTPATNTPTPTEQEDDFIVDANGNIGMGILLPSVKLHIKSATSPAITLADGTQGAGRILGSDANGVGTWITPPVTKTSVLGVFPAATTSSTLFPKSNGLGTPVYSLLSIKLAPGEWAVNLGLVFDELGTNTFWEDIYLSNNSVTIDRTGFTHSGSVTADPLYGGVLPGTVTFTTSTDKKGFVTGRAIITVTGPLPITIYVMLQNQASGYYRFNPLAPENYFYAFPLN